MCASLQRNGEQQDRHAVLPQDRENAQKYLTGAKESFKADGCDLTQMLGRMDSRYLKPLRRRMTF